MALQDDGAINKLKRDVEENDIEEDLEYVTDDDYLSDSDSGRTSSDHIQMENCQTNAEKTEEGYHEKLSRRLELVEDAEEDDDYIRVLQEQLQQVQFELENLHIGRNDKGQTGANDETLAVRSLHSPDPDHSKAEAEKPRCEIYSPVETTEHRGIRNTFLHAQGDTRGIPNIRPNVEHYDTLLAASEADVASSNTSENIDNKLAERAGRRSKIPGRITKGLRSRTDVRLSRNKAFVTAKDTEQKIKKARQNRMIEDNDELSAKIATLQKRDPKLPGPDKGIVWPTTMDVLSKTDKAYYVEQFLRSQLFRQRCLKKYQGSKTWMNSLTPFQLWVLENEDTAVLQAVLKPVPKSHKNAKFKIECWRDDTPPPSPQPES